LTYLKKTSFKYIIYILILLFSFSSNADETTPTAIENNQKNSNKVSSQSKLTLGSDGFDATADSFEYVGDNVIATGNVFIRRDNLLLYADKAIYNIVDQNVELAGNVKFFQLERSRQQLEYWDVKTLENNPYVKFKVVGTVMTASGRQLLVIDEIRQNMTWSGDRAIGNLKTGIFEFGSFATGLSDWAVIGQGGTRKANGDIILKDAVASPCPDLIEGHSVFSIKSKKIMAYPSASSQENNYIQGAKQQQAQMPREGAYNNYDFWAYNNILYIGDIPVLWFPVMYKPAKGQGNFNISAGSSSQYGYYLETTNTWKLSETPDLTISNFLNYYSKRGPAAGNYTTLSTDNSQSEFFIWGILDHDPNINVPDYSRWGNNSQERYELSLKNMTHLTDNVDFRGQANKLSDYYFLNDYFGNQFSNMPQPPTYADLSYQMQYGSADVLIHPKINSFYSVVEQLPQLQINIPRQELFANIYYQGETSFSNMKMNWATFKNKYPASPIPGYSTNVTDYDAFRFDTLHFLYYPIKVDNWLDIVPRAGIRATVYSESSKSSVSKEDLEAMMASVNPQSQTTTSYLFNNYDNKGGWKARFAPELGVNMSTKFSQTWNDFKNAYWELDGLRHVVQPYINYTYIMPPTVDRDHLYYFDDVDRITEENFVRLGIENRLETRRGGWKNSQTYTWVSMENYIDILATPKSQYADSYDDKQGIENLGDWGNIITINPNEQLSISLQLLIDASKIAPGVSITDMFDQASISANWEFADGWSVNGGYYYASNNDAEGPYSMGSELTAIQNGTVFFRDFNNSSYATAGLGFEINDRTTGNINISYDFEQEIMPSLGISINRQLPCGLQLILAYSIDGQRNTAGTSTDYQSNFSASLGFSPEPIYAVSPRDDGFLPGEITVEPGT